MVLDNDTAKAIADIAREAGGVILAHYAGSRKARAKADRSPVTDADIAAHDYILAALTRLLPGIPVVSEEDVPPAEFDPNGRFFLVDPLDGTRSYVEGTGEFCVNIGLIEERRPVYGALFVPVQDKLYWGGAGLGAWRQEKKGAAYTPIQTRETPKQGLTVAISSKHPSARMSGYLASLPVAATMGMSSAAKLTLVAEGSVDLYPRFGRTMEWDTAAGHAILNAAGGRLETEDGQAFLYGKPDFANPGFVAYGR